MYPRTATYLSYFFCLFIIFSFSLFCYTTKCTIIINLITHTSRRKMMQLLKKHLPVAVLFAIAAALLSSFKMSIMIGPYPAAFSLTHCFTPLVGMFGGFSSAFFFLLRTCCKFFTASTYSHIAFMLHIPTLFAALYWKSVKTPSYKKLFAPLVCSICIVLFWIHPVGAQATPYTLYWFIPIGIALLNCKNIFLHALGSTFTAHAVGSIIWLYCGLIPEPNTWLTLIPVVALERLVFASGMTLIYTFMTSVTEHMEQLFQRITKQVQG